MLAIEKAVAMNPSDRTVLLFLTDPKQLDLALLCANFSLKMMGVKVVYMGTDISISNLKNVFEKITPHYLYTYLPKKNKFQIRELSVLLEEHAPQAKLIITTPREVDALPHTANNMLHLNYDGALEKLMS